MMGGLPKAAPTDPTFQDKVDRRKGELAGPWKPGALAVEYRAVRRAREELDARVSEINVEIAALEQLIWSSFEDEGISSVRLENGDSVSVQPEPVASVKDHDALRSWAIANGHERQLQLPWVTVNAVAKQRLLDGEPPPDGVELAVRNKTVLRKG